MPVTKDNNAYQPTTAQREHLVATLTRFEDGWPLGEAGSDPEGDARTLVGIRDKLRARPGTLSLTAREREALWSAAYAMLSARWPDPEGALARALQKLWVEDGP